MSKWAKTVRAPIVTGGALGVKSQVHQLQHNGSSRGWHGGACGTAPSGGLPLDTLPLLLHALDARASRIVQCEALYLGSDTSPALPIRKLFGCGIRCSWGDGMFHACRRHSQRFLYGTKTVSVKTKEQVRRELTARDAAATTAALQTGQ